MAIEEGRPAPPFTLPDSDGKPVSLSDYAGRQLIVYFYPKDDTPGCTKQACGFRDAWSELRRQDVAVVGISPDDGESHKKFIAKYELPFTLLCDPDKRVMTDYQAYGKKMLYGKEVIGVIRSTVWVDPQGVVKKHWRRVAKAADHAEKVLAALARA